jgi:hypothetical protein
MRRLALALVFLPFALPAWAQTAPDKPVEVDSSAYVAYYQTRLQQAEQNAAQAVGAAAALQHRVASLEAEVATLKAPKPPKPDAAAK